MGDGTAFDPSAVGSAPPIPRGIVDNNPWNVTGAGWPGQTGSDGPFAKFDNPDQGAAAADQNLLSYATKHGINTVQDAVNRWTNNGASPQYLAAISSALGVKPTDHVDFTNPAVRQTFLAAAKPHETGSGPPPPSAADFMADFEAAQGKGSPAAPSVTTNPAAIPAPSPSVPSVTLPDGMTLNMAAARDVNVAKGGGYTDAAGKHYTASPEHGDGYFTDDSGALFHITPPVDAPPPTPQDFMADFEKSRGKPAPEPGADTPITALGMLKQIPGAISDTVNGVLNSLSVQTPPGSSQEGDEAAALGDLLHPKGSDARSAAIQAQAGQANPQMPDLAPAPANIGERAVRFASNLLPAALVGPEEGASALANLAFRTKNVVYPALTGTASGEAVKAMGGSPGEVSAAQAMGSIPGSIAAVPSAVKALSGLVGNAAKPFLAQVGPKVEVAPGVFATRSAADQAGQFLANQATDHGAVTSALAGLVPDTVPGSTRTLGAVTGDRGLLDNERNVASTDPTGFNDMQARQNAARRASIETLATGGDPVAVGDHIRGMISDLDSRLQADVEGARASAEATTAAATAKAQGLVSEAKDATQEHLEGTQAKGAAAVQSATDAAKDAAAGLGGTGRPEEYGATIRDNVTKALKASDEREAGLWDALKPYGDLTGNVTATRIAARNVLADMTEDSLPMSASERAIFDRVSQWPETLPVKNVLDMRKQINAIAGQEFAANGATPTYARLTALRNALGENLSTTLADNIQRPGVAAKIQEWENGSQPNSEARSVAGGSGQQPPAEGAAPVAATGGTALPAGGGSGSAAGTQGVSAEVPNLTPATLKGTNTHLGWVDDQGKFYSDAEAKALRAQTPSAPKGATVPPAPEAPVPAIPSGTQPTITPEVHAEMQGATAAANAATKEQAETFRQGPVAPTLQTYGYQGQFKMPNGLVPGQFFKPGAAGAEAMRALAKASPESMPAIHDYAVSTLQAMAPDGVITPKVLQRWQARYGESISEMPDDMKAAFGVAAQKGQAIADTGAAAQEAAKASVAAGKEAVGRATAAGNEITDEAAKTASKTVADAVSARKAAYDAATAGAIGKVMGVPPGDPVAVTRTVGRILGSDTGVSDMRSLVAATKGNAAAASGLKQAVVDHITNSLISNTEAGVSGTNKISANAFQNFLKKSGPALSEVLSPDEMFRLHAIGSDIAESQRTLGATKLAGESNTYEKMVSGGTQGKSARVIGDSIGAVVGAALGHMTGVGELGSFVGGGIGTGMADLIGSLRAAGVRSVADLVKAGTFDANVGRALLQRVKGPQNLTPTSGPGKALLRVLIAPTAATLATKPQSKTPSALEGVR